MAYPSRLTQLLDEGRIAIRSGIKFEFASGTYAFCSGKSNIVADGVIFLANNLIEIEEPTAIMGTAAVPLKMKLPAHEDFGLTPDILATIETTGYKGKPVTFYDFYFDPDDRSLLYVEKRFYGYMDTIDHMGGVEFYLQGNAETSSLDNFRNGYRSASHEDQQLVFPGDGFFRYASGVKNEFFDISL